MKRIITLQDISCVGKCSLTVALPIISCMGIEACPLPTALLSNHTAFDRFSFFDLNSHMNSVIDEFKAQDFKFDGIYSAYLGSTAQVDTVCGFIDYFKKEGSITLVDPVMGDHGRLYSGFTRDFPIHMKRLCKKADVIVPNITEAGFLLGFDGALEYTDIYSLKPFMKQLCLLGPKISVLTGVEQDGKLGGAIYDIETDEFYFYLLDKIDRTFHGTGDVFASVLFSCLVNGLDIKLALKKAVDFVYAAMKATIENKDAAWYGVDFERVLPLLFERS